jgi:hypothetical protein
VDFTVLADDAEFVFPVMAIFHQPGETTFQPASVLGMNVAEEQVSGDSPLSGRQAKQLILHSAPDGAVRAHVPFPHTHLSGIEGDPQPLFPFPKLAVEEKGFFLPFSSCQVGYGRAKTAPARERKGLEENRY